MLATFVAVWKLPVYQAEKGFLPLALFYSVRVDTANALVSSAL